MDHEQLEYRVATPVGVRHLERVIDLIACPYNETARVFRRRQARWVDEEFDRGAFAGVSGDVFVNRAHDVERPLGRVIRFHPGDERGLRTELRIAKTAEGDDVLELADEGLLSASVGFAIPAGGERWSEDRSRVKVTKALLEHIAMTADPAYTQARVLAVRSNADGAAPSVRVATPNLDRLRLEMAAERLGLKTT